MLLFVSLLYCVFVGSRPGSGLLERRPAMYADKDGVQLRGDKGKARRKSTASQISKPNQINAPVSKLV